MIYFSQIPVIEDRSARLYVVEGKTNEEKGNLKDLCLSHRAFRAAVKWMSVVL